MSDTNTQMQTSAQAPRRAYVGSGCAGDSLNGTRPAKWRASETTPAPATATTTHTTGGR